MKPDFVQTDCKGHPGYTSWFSQVPGASVSPGVVKDALKQWRAATRRLGMPLHCHYSGIWDTAAGVKHPSWCVVPSGPKRKEAAAGKMCPRSPYLEKLLIPQLIELIDRYGVDGFWIDGDLWGVEPCYCKRCRQDFSRATGLKHPPRKESDPRWPAWWAFTLQSFEQYVTRYCDAVHQHKPGVLVCSNWLQTFRNPGEPVVPTDWISGDNTWVWGLDASRCEARFLSTRGKPWDIMLWNFYCSHGMGKPDSPWVVKPVPMLQQEAAVLLAFGGNVQIYENPGAVRSGQLIPWRMKRMGAVGRFVKARRSLCQDTTTLPQIAVLHSECHVHATVRRRNLMWGVDVAPVQGATFSLLENHFGVDVLDEWALQPRLKEFPVIVVPEQHALSAAMVTDLKAYVKDGGKLLVSGAESWDPFGSEFLGVTAGTVEEKCTYHVPAEEGMAPLYSEQWRLVTPTTARAHGCIGRSLLTDDRLLPHPVLTINRVGRGAVGYIPAAVFRDFEHNRYPGTRTFIGEAVRRLAGRFPIKVEAPLSVDVTLRRKRSRILVHLVNRSSGIPNQQNNGVIDAIPPVGPVRITLTAARRPRRVTAAFEKTTLSWSWTPARRGGTVRIEVPAVGIHLAVVVDE
jgi:hypothetical protein